MKSRTLKIILMMAFIITLISANMVGAFASEQQSLQFNSDGKFKILIIADTQDTDKTQQNTLDLIEASLEKTKPDLVVFTGDNVAGKWRGVDEESTHKAIDNIVKEVDSRKIPFAVVFGNHDDEGGVSRETQMKIFGEYDTCLAIEGEDMTGCGNYNLPIKNSKGDKDVFNLWFIDSNTYADEGGYAYVADDQIAWYEKTSNELKEKNAGAMLPSVLFQHIAVPESYELLTEVPKGTKDAVKGHGIHSGKYFVANDGVTQGLVKEIPCSPNINNGQFNSWLKQGDILGAFFGHDHVNDFSGNVRGIQLTQAPGAGFYSYGDRHGVRTVELDENNLTTFESESLFFEDVVGDDMGNPLVASVGYYMYKAIYLPAICGGIAVAAVAITIVSIVVVRVKKKRKNT